MTHCSFFFWCWWCILWDHFNAIECVIFFLNVYLCLPVIRPFIILFLFIFVQCVATFLTGQVHAFFQFYHEHSMHLSIDGIVSQSKNCNRLKFIVLLLLPLCGWMHSKFELKLKLKLNIDFMVRHNITEAHNNSHIN